MRLMSAPCLCVLVCLHLVHCNMFLERLGALQLLGSTSRRRRANSLLLEEVLPGDLERECYEELCSEEEATEIFRTREKTMEFWFRYKNVPRCRSNLCLNGGLCSEQQGLVQCLCAPGFHGPHCDKEARQCAFKNGGCVQYCSDLPGGAGVQCGCAPGYRLEEDGLSCSTTVLFPCGRQQNQDWIRMRSLSDLDQNGTLNQTWVTDHNWTETWVPEGNTSAQGFFEVEQNASGLEQNASGAEQNEDERIVGGVLEKQGGSPWTVLIRRADGFGFCGGTLVSERWVISAAHCFYQTQADHITIGGVDKLRLARGEQRIKVQRILIHPHFHDYTFDSDLALVLLQSPVVLGPTALPACLPDPHLSTALLQKNTVGVVSGWGTMHYLGRSSRFLRKVALPVVSQRACSLSTEQVITDNMFCAGFVDASQDSCSGDSGGPFVVHFRGVWLLTGVVSWGEQCAARGKYGVYTRLGNFLGWIRETMDQEERALNQDQRLTPGPDQDLNGTNATGSV